MARPPRKMFFLYRQPRVLVLPLFLPLPAKEPGLSRLEEYIRAKADGPDHDHSCTNDVELAEVIGIHNQKTEAGSGTWQHLSGYHAHPRDGKRDPQPGPDAGKGTGKDHGPEFFKCRCMEHLCDFNPSYPDSLHTIDRVDEDRKECAQDNDEKDRVDADPKPGDGKRQPGYRGDRAEDLDDGIEIRLDLF